MMFVFIKKYRLQTVGAVTEMDRHILFMLPNNSKWQNTIILAKFEKCCYFGKISSKQHVLNVGKELMLQFMEVF